MCALTAHNEPKPNDSRSGVMFGSSPAPEARPVKSWPRSPSTWHTPLLCLVMATLLWLGWAPAPAVALQLPAWGNRGGTPRAPQSPLVPTPPTGHLQEVTPPQAVQQLQQALAGYQPRVTITAPQDGSVLEAGPWQLRVRVQDWPLVDAGTLGLGSHLVVQIDDQPPRRLTAADAPGGDGEVVLQGPPLSPGTHRITAYAARPWGEAVKSPGALEQIRVHRLVANPQALPAPGSVQLIPVSPAELSQGEPVLLDWILLDAPLQNLRPGDGSWRLRVTINGDSFLVDQNVPLWLRGWRPGDNSLLLELVDGRGEPLNPPFNSLVTAVTLSRPGPDAANRPRWLQGRLSDQELAQLLGQLPAPEPEPMHDLELIPAEPEPDVVLQPDLDQDFTQTPDRDKNQNQVPDPDPAPDPDPEPEPEPDQDQDQDQALVIELQPEPQQEPEPDMAPPPSPLAAANSARISSGTALEGSARELVNPDGSLIQPRPNGPLAGLRQRFNP